MGTAVVFLCYDRGNPNHMEAKVMSEQETNQTAGSITINVTENGLSYDTNFNLMETIFWLESLKNEILRNVFSPELVAD